MKITLIGAGNMGGSLVRSWSGHSQDGITVCATASSKKTIDTIQSLCPDVATTLDNRAAARDADIVVLAVKPWLVDSVLKQVSDVLDLSKQALVSVAAGVGLEDLSSILGQSGNLFVAMPNIAAQVSESMTFVSAGREASEEVQQKVVKLFAMAGKVMLCSEKELAAGMMMAGCGIAYVMRFIRAMMEGGVEMGLYPAKAQEIAQQTMLGAVKYLESTGLHPEMAIDRVTTPGGVTIKGLNELDHAGFNSAVIRCLKAGLK